MTGCYADKLNCDSYVEALGSLEWEDDDSGCEAVLVLMAAMGMTQAEFRELDEHPGHWSKGVGDYRDSQGRAWHWKLRRTRNQRGGYFPEIFRANEPISPRSV